MDASAAGPRQSTHAGSAHRQAQRRIRPIPNLFALRMRPHPALPSSYIGRVRRLGSKTSRRGEADAVYEMPHQEVYSADGARDGAARIQSTLKTLAVALGRCVVRRDPRGDVRSCVMGRVALQGGGRPASQRYAAMPDHMCDRISGFD
jgi:hypothetical protein